MNGEGSSFRTLCERQMQKVQQNLVTENGMNHGTQRDAAARNALVP